MRVGLTGGLGSGKSTAAVMFAARGAHVLSADEIARGLMTPGHDVYDQIVQQFGRSMLLPDGTLDRNALARLAFSGGRIEQLNAIVHPAAIALQQQIADEILVSDPDAIVLVESALIFETKYGETVHGAGWRGRFDRMILVTATEANKIARFCKRSGGSPGGLLEAEARRRLAQMMPDEQKIQMVDFVIHNDGTLAELRAQVDNVWEQLTAGAASGV